MKILNYINDNTLEFVFCADNARKCKNFAGTYRSFHRINKLKNCIRELRAEKSVFGSQFLFLKHCKALLIMQRREYVYWKN